MTAELHHQEERSVASLTIAEVLELMSREHIPLGATFGVPGGSIAGPVLTWKVADD